MHENSQSQGGLSPEWYRKLVATVKYGSSVPATYAKLYRSSDITLQIEVWSYIVQRYHIGWFASILTIGFEPTQLSLYPSVNKEVGERKLLPLNSSDILSVEGSITLVISGMLIHQIVCASDTLGRQSCWHDVCLRIHEQHHQILVDRFLFVYVRFQMRHRGLQCSSRQADYHWFTVGIFPAGLRGKPGSIWYTAY